MKLTQIGPPPGVKDLQTLLRFLDDTELFEKRLAKMEELRDQLNATVDNVGAIGNIEQAKGAAAADRKKAAQVLEQTTEKAKTMMADVDAAIEENERRSKELDKREREIRNQEQNIARKQHDMQVEANRREAEINGKLKELQRERQQVSNLHKEQQEKAMKLKELAEAM